MGKSAEEVRQQKEKKLDQQILEVCFLANFSKNYYLFLEKFLQIFYCAKVVQITMINLSIRFNLVRIL